MWNVREFNELSLEELEQILRIRQDVFIIEQESLFTDIDGQDANAIHIFSKKDEQILAYCRLIINEAATIGRVIVIPSERADGKGRELFSFALDYIAEKHPSLPVKITAMCYLEKFYESFGFKIVSDRYDIAGHLHVEMEL